MKKLGRLIKARKLTQKSVAKLFGVTQPRISDLVRGKIDLFSIDMLVNMRARAPGCGLISGSRASARGRRAQAAKVLNDIDQEF